MTWIVEICKERLLRAFGVHPPNASDSDFYAETTGRSYGDNGRSATGHLLPGVQADYARLVRPLPIFTRFCSLGVTFSLLRKMPYNDSCFAYNVVVSFICGLRGIDPIRNARGAESDHRTANPQENFVSDMLRCSPSKDH